MKIRDSVAFVTGANRGIGLPFVHSPLTQKKEDTMSANDTLSYDVFVSEPIPLNVTGLLPSGEPHSRRCRPRASTARTTRCPWTRL